MEYSNSFPEVAMKPLATKSREGTAHSNRSNVSSGVGNHIVEMPHFSRLRYPLSLLPNPLSPKSLTLLLLRPVFRFPLRCFQFSASLSASSEQSSPLPFFVAPLYLDSTLMIGEQLWGPLGFHLIQMDCWGIWFPCFLWWWWLPPIAEE